MRDALRERAAPQKRANPKGPVQPLDLPDVGNIPLGQDNRVRIQDGQAILSTKIGNAPVDVRIGEKGVELGGEGATILDRAREILPTIKVQPTQGQPVASPSGEATGRATGRE